MSKRSAESSQKPSILEVLKIERVPPRHRMSDDDPLLPQVGSPEISPLPAPTQQSEADDTGIEEINSDDSDCPTKRFKGDDSTGNSNLAELNTVYPDYLAAYDSPTPGQAFPATPQERPVPPISIFQSNTPKTHTTPNPTTDYFPEIKIEKTSEDGSINGTPSRALNDSGYFESKFEVPKTSIQTPPRYPMYRNEAIGSFSGHHAVHPYGVNFPHPPNGQETNQPFQQSQFGMMPFGYGGMSPAMVQEHHHRIMQHMMMIRQQQQQYYEENRVQYFNGHQISPTKIKITNTTERVTSPGPVPADFDPEIHGSTSHPILVKISKYSLTSTSTGINFYFRIFGRVFKARRDSFSKDKTMMYLRCNTCPKEPCKWRAKIRLLNPEIKIEDEKFQDIENYQVLSNTKAHHHHPACRELSLTDSDMVGNTDNRLSPTLALPDASPSAPQLTMTTMATP
ncbi:Oidioi.mRNA.OKI2018_I69.XSR.g13809.t1.cds [Oikopleura dioica]|uniref:Oidioi.mRNA.OKI2018_I69.XSR.g13809.t1.cds n=1 Tax=Oikopleura dioica TaxID=34765 RepID=A0ABN7SE47_OIKDI|nr:Oidioi.mRNA.OKI2018_I69.XSR.g13809.t1.cds [Oikopleura dioica]